MEFKKLKMENMFIYVLFTVIMILVLANKRNLHIDEILTYGLANYPAGWITPVDGEVYNPADSVFSEYVAVHKDNRFNYKNVWNNQARDTHPPVYYALVHTICSLFPGRFSIWYAGGINIIFALLSLWAARSLLYELTHSENVVILASIFIMFSTGILSSISFLRMYVMAMFEVTFITLLFVKAVTKKRTWKFYAVLIAVSAIGALTHYYVLVYLFFACLVFGVYLLINKNYKEIGIFIISMIISAGFSITVFPNMIKHMFLKEGYRGQESIENLTQSSIAEYGNRLKCFYSFINEQLFGGILTYMAVAVLIFMIWQGISKKCGREVKYRKILSDLSGRIHVQWMLAAIPSICSFLLISKMAVYITERYLFPIYAVVMVIIVSLVYCCSKKLFDTKHQWTAVVIMMSIMTVNSSKLCRWPFLYQDSTGLLTKAAEHSGENSIYIYDDATWKIYSSFYEVSNYNSVVFFHKDNIDAIGKAPCMNDDSMVVIIIDSCDKESILNKILGACPFLDNYEKIGSFGYATSYQLYNKNIDVKQYRIYDYEHSGLLGCNNTAFEENICVTAQDILIKTTFSKETGYGTLWTGNWVFDIQNGAFSDGSNIRLWSYNGTNAQRWKIKENADGTYTIFSQDEHYAMARDNNGNVYLSTFKENDTAQKWWVEILEEDNK